MHNLQQEPITVCNMSMHALCIADSPQVSPTYMKTTPAKPPIFEADNNAAGRCLYLTIHAFDVFPLIGPVMPFG